MYYIFDAYLNHLSYNKTVQDLNAELNRVNIQGEQSRITGIRKMPELFRDAVIKKNPTVTIVGSAQTLADAIGPALEHDITLGFIPADPEEKLAQVLGLTSYSEAAQAIARRLFEEITVLRVNDRYCISTIEAAIDARPAAKRGLFEKLSGYFGADDAPAMKAKLVIDDRYMITTQITELTIFNLHKPNDNPLATPERINANDRSFEISFRVKQDTLRQQFQRRGFSRRQIKDLSPYSLVNARRLDIISPKNVPLLSDGVQLTKTPATIHIPQKKLRLIVGRNKTF